MNKEDIRSIQSALRFLLGFLNDKIRYGIYNPARCETKELCQEVCTELIRLIELLEKENENEKS